VGIISNQHSLKLRGKTFLQWNQRKMGVGMKSIKRRRRMKQASSRIMQRMRIIMMN